jgi:formate dehydrogenase subunit delta
MSDGKMARMANDIANFFQAYPHDEAVAGIHHHVTAFWTPKMRAALVGLARDGDGGLHPLVVEAMLRGNGAGTPAAKEAAGPAEVGEIGASDAG